MVATVVVLFVAKNLKIVSFPGLTRDLPRKVDNPPPFPVNLTHGIVFVFVFFF